MDRPRKASMSWDEARGVLGIAAEADDAAMRAAYLKKVQEYPPDRDPDAFERVRDAYDQLRDPRIRARQVLSGPDPLAPLPTLLEGLPPRRGFIGPRPWIEALKEKMKERRT